LGEELDLARKVFFDDLLDALVAEGELPVRRHHVDAEQLAGVDHVLALSPERGARTLPGIAAIEQQGVGPAGAQLLHQRGEVGEAADLAIGLRGLGEVEIGESVCLR
jgi:hypothetical protein